MHIKVLDPSHAVFYPARVVAHELSRSLENDAQAAFGREGQGDGKEMAAWMHVIEFDEVETEGTNRIRTRVAMRDITNIILLLQVSLTYRITPQSTRVFPILILS